MDDETFDVVVARCRFAGEAVVASGSFAAGALRRDLEADPTLLPREPAWLGEALADALRDQGVAVRTRTTVQQLADHVHAFPTWSEAVHVPARELADLLRRRGRA